MNLGQKKDVHSVYQQENRKMSSRFKTLKNDPANTGKTIVLTKNKLTVDVSLLHSAYAYLPTIYLQPCTRLMYISRDAGTFFDAFEMK